MDRVRGVRHEKYFTQGTLIEDAFISQKNLSIQEGGKDCPSVTANPRSRSVVSFNKGFIELSGRSETVYPAPIHFIDLFCGIGGFRYASLRAFKALKVIGKCVFSSDIDRYARDSYEANFGERPAGDITKVDAAGIPDFDLLFGGFPCQSFSICGQMKGFSDKTRGTLFFDVARILKEKRPQAFVLENVKNLVSHDNGKTLSVILDALRNELGYHVEYHVLNALNFGLPQKRERILLLGSKKPFVMNWEFNVTKRKTLNDILEKNVDPKFYASPEIVNKRKSRHTPSCAPSIWHENKSGNISSYPYSCALRAGASYNYLLVNGERRLTPREMLRLQGFPDSFKIVVSDFQTRKQAGNAIPVDMVSAVIQRFLPLAF